MLIRLNKMVFFSPIVLVSLIFFSNYKEHASTPISPLNANAESCARKLNLFIFTITTLPKLSLNFA